MIEIRLDNIVSIALMTIAAYAAARAIDAKLQARK